MMRLMPTTITDTHLAEYEGVPLAEAASEAGIDVADVERLVAELVAEGLLERRAVQ